MFSTLKFSSGRRQQPREVGRMNAARLMLASALIFSGCRTMHDVAVTSFHVIDAPAHYVREHIDHEQTTTTTTTTTSDVTTPGAPVASPTPRVVHRETTNRRTTASVQETARTENAS